MFYWRRFGSELNDAGKRLLELINDLAAKNDIALEFTTRSYSCSYDTGH